MQRILQRNRSHWRGQTRHPQPIRGSLGSHASSEVAADRHTCSFPKGVKICTSHDFKQLEVLVDSIQDISTHDIPEMAQLTLKRGHEMITRPIMHESPHFFHVQRFAIFVQLELDRVRNVP
jgi:hypothetical protein